MEQHLNDRLTEVLSFYFPNPERPVLLRRIKSDVFLIGVGSKKYVVKEYSPTFSPERLNFFEDLQNFTSERMGTLPQVMETSEKQLNVLCDGFGYDLTEFVKSKTIDRNEVKNKETFFFYMGSFVGNLHRTFSEFEKTGHPTIKSLLKIDSDTPKGLEDLLKRYQEKGIGEPWVQMVKDKIALVGAYSSVPDSFALLPQRVVHGDLYLKNILLDKNQKIIGLIDFANSGTFFKCYEVIRAVIQTNRFFQKADLDPAHLKSFLLGYLENCELCEDEFEKILSLYIYAQAADASFLDIDSIHDSETKKYAMYRFNSLNSLHRNHQLLTSSINDLRKQKRK